VALLPALPLVGVKEVIEGGSKTRRKT